MKKHLCSIAALLAALFVYTMIAMLELLIKPRTQADTPDSPTERTTD